MEYQNLVMDYLNCRLPTFGVAEFINVRGPDFIVAVRHELIFGTAFINYYGWA